MSSWCHSLPRPHRAAASGSTTMIVAPCGQRTPADALRRVQQQATPPQRRRYAAVRCPTSPARLSARFADGTGLSYVLARTGTRTGHFKSIVHPSMIDGAIVADMQALRTPPGGGHRSRAHSPPAAPLAAMPQCARASSLRPQPCASGPLVRAARAGTRRPPPRHRWKQRITALRHATVIHHARACRRTAPGNPKGGRRERQGQGQGQVAELDPLALIS